MVRGNFDGDIEIGEGTSAQSQIKLPVSLDEDGTIQVNTSQGDFDAGGLIQIGVPPIPSAPRLVYFDGCIRIFDEAGTGDGGDLTGSIVVYGCHVTGDDLNICIDGDDNGNVSIIQTDCPTVEVGYSCGGCP